MYFSRIACPHTIYIFLRRRRRRRRNDNDISLMVGRRTTYTARPPSFCFEGKGEPPRPSP
jgi:hypothetical protein